MRPIEYVGRDSDKAAELEKVIAQAKSEIEQCIRHLVNKFGGFKLIVETAPMRADDHSELASFEPGDAVRITIRPNFRRRRR